MDDWNADDGDSTLGNQRPGLEADRISRAAWAFTTRRVPREQQFSLSHQGGSPPRAGDLILARLDALGFHRALQLRNGRRKNLFPGNEIVVAYGNRYAPSQFEAVVPKTLGPCHLVAGGGVAAKALSWHDRVARGPTLITPVGYLLRGDGERANLRDYALDPVKRLFAPSPTTIAVVGTTMDSGKTTSAAFLVRGLSQAGMRVGYAKVTGTGAGGDTWLLRDAGAFPVLDFTDTGYVSTYRVDLPELERILITLVAHLAEAGVDAVVLEVADGILQSETAALLESPLFKAIVGGVFFAAGDAMGAVAGVSWLKARDLPIAGLGGVMTAGPLQAMEATRATGIQTFRREDLEQPDVARSILAGVRKLRMISGGASARTDENRESQERAAER